MGRKKIEVVFGRTESIARSYLRSFVFSPEEEVELYSREMTVTNKRVIYVATVSRGFYCDFAYVDKDISIDDFNGVIKPTVKDFDESKISYY